MTVFDFGVFLHSRWAVKYNTGIDLFGGIICGFCIYWYSTVMTNEEKISSIVHFALFQLLREQRFESLFFTTLKLFIKMHFLYETCHNMFFIIKHIAVLLVFTLFRCHYTFLLGFLASTTFILSLDTNNTQRSKIEREVDNIFDFTL